MSVTKIIQYIHRPIMTELGLGNTHETYMLVDSKTDMSGVFPPGESVDVFNSTQNKTYTLKSSKGNEFRINQMGVIYRDFNVMPGDEIIITHYDSDGAIHNYIDVHNYNRIGVNVNGNGSEIVNIDRLTKFSNGERTYSFLVNADGMEKEMTISFLESRNKRSDSPSETDYYNVSLEGRPLPNGKYYINIDDIVTLIPMPQKSEFNQVILDNTPISNLIPKFSENKQVIYYGAPGTGKSFEINKITKDKEVIRTTFHPDSDYSTFVGAYKPTSIEVPVRDVTGKIIVENGEQVKENRIVYEFVEQAFLQAYTKAWRAYANRAEGEKAEELYLVIEEINRGNCAQIFGDLFQLLDRNDYGFSDYPITADKDMKKQLAKAFDKMTIADAERINSIYGKDVVSKVLNGDILLLPDNLYIWATMNTSDQSLFPIDSAFKRRWDWKYVPISEGVNEQGEKLGYTLEVAGKKYDWWTFLEKINDKIDEQTKSEDKKLGYFFCKAHNGVIDAETFVSKVVFYLWNDVFKDQDDAGVFSDGDDDLTFRKFYDTDSLGKAVINEDKVEVLLKNLEVKLASEVEDASVNEEVVPEGTQEESSDTNTLSNNIETEGNDTTTYSFDGKENLGKGQLAVSIIEKYMKEHPNLSYKELKDIFPDSMMGNSLKLIGLIVKEDDVKNAPYSYQKKAYGYFKPERRYKDVNGVDFFVSNYWNITNIQNIIDFAKQQGWIIESK